MAFLVPSTVPGMPSIVKRVAKTKRLRVFHESPVPHGDERGQQRAVSVAAAVSLADQVWQAL